jgi:ribosomal protein S18 acetylase RimI-like enzyme
MSVDITPPTYAEAPAIAALMREVFEQTYGAAIPKSVLYPYLDRTFSLQSMVGLINDGKANLLVAHKHHHIVGVCQMREAPAPNAPPSESAIEIERFYLLPSEHGNGSATRLLHAAEHYAHDRHAHYLWLCVWEHNKRAIGFYLKHRFAEIGTTSIWVDGVHFRDYVLSKTIKIEL